MRTTISMLVVFLVAASAPATEPVVRYYVAEAKLSSADGRPLTSEVLVLKRVVDREKSTIVEKPVIVDERGKALEWTLRFAVKDDGTFTLTEDSKRVEGKGKLFGPAWKWTYFKATYKATDGVEIEDENFLLDESLGVARQKVMGKDKKVVMYRDIAGREITAKTYEILRAGLLK